MCHGWLQWILEMLGIPKQTKIHEHQRAGFVLLRRKFCASVTPTKRTAKFCDAKTISCFSFLSFSSFIFYQQREGKKVFVMDSSKPSLSYILSTNMQTSSGFFHNYNKASVTLVLLLLPPLELAC